MGSTVLWLSRLPPKLSALLVFRLEGSGQCVYWFWQVANAEKKEVITWTSQVGSSRMSFGSCLQTPHKHCRLVDGTWVLESRQIVLRSCQITAASREPTSYSLCSSAVSSITISIDLGLEAPGNCLPADSARFANEAYG